MYGCFLFLMTNVSMLIVILVFSSCEDFNLEPPSHCYDSYLIHDTLKDDEFFYKRYAHNVGFCSSVFPFDIVNSAKLMFLFLFFLFFNSILCFQISQ